MSDLAISAERLSKQYRLGQLRSGYGNLVDWAARREKSTLWALEDVSFDVQEGEAVAVIGRNGAGKSTLLKILSRITDPTSGYADVWGRVGSLLEVGTGFHPELTGRENVYLNGTILGMQRDEIARKFSDIIEFAGVERFVETPVKRYSSGMQVRLAFAVAAYLEPEILLVDEVLAVGDAEFQKRCLGRMGDVAREGRTVLFVSHNMHAVRALCDRAILLEGGRVVEDGPVEGAVRRYLSAADRPESGLRQWDDPPGDGVCRLLGIAVSDGAGEPSTTIMSGHPAQVTMEVEIGEVDPALCIGFDITTPDGVQVFRSFHTDVDAAERPELVPGRNVLRCTIPPGLLNAGRYVVNPRISLHIIRWIVHEDSAMFFDVVFAHGDSEFLYAEPRPGVVAPILEWESSPVASVVEGR